MEPVPPLVTWSSSDTAVASVTPAEGGTARVVARRAGTATLTIRSTRDSANVLTTPVAVRVAPVGDERGLVYAATAALRPSSGGSATDEAPLGPMELDVRVTISNSAAESRSLWLSACAAWIRIYRTADRAGPPVADLPRGTECGSGPQLVTFAPGESKSYPGLGYRLTLASDTLPTGRFYVAAAVDRLRDLHEVPAGAVDVVSPNAGLAFTGTTAVATVLAGAAGDTLHTRVTVRNTNALGVRLEYGACALDLLAFRAPTRSGTPAWTSSAQRAPTGQPFACPLYLAMGVLRPGQEVSPGELTRGSRRARCSATPCRRGGTTSARGCVSTGARRWSTPARRTCAVSCSVPGCRGEGAADPLGLLRPSLAPELVGRQPAECLQAPRVVVGVKEQLQVRAELVVCVVVVPVDRRVLDRGVHAPSCAQPGRWSTGGRAESRVPDVELFARVREGVDAPARRLVIERPGRVGRGGRRAVEEPEAVVDQHGGGRVRQRRRERAPQEVGGNAARGARVQWSEGERGPAVDGHEQGEAALLRADLRCPCGGSRR
jgi:hypothetical protein